MDHRRAERRLALRPFHGVPVGAAADDDRPETAARAVRAVRAIEPAARAAQTGCFRAHDHLVTND